MSDVRHEKKYPLVPPNEFRCIWMTAGILSYQLCDRDFDCEHCPLDAAMRTHYSTHTVLRQRTPAESGRETKLTTQRNLLFSLHHCWVERRSDTLVRVGIDQGLATALVSPKAVAFPSVGEDVKKNQICLWIVTDGGTYPGPSPVSGRVWATNSNLNERPLSLLLQPLDQGWLFELDVGRGADDESLLKEDEARASFAEKDERLRAAITRALSRLRPPVGETLADGGEPLRIASDMLGAKKYFSILCEVFT